MPKIDYKGSNISIPSGTDRFSAALIEAANTGFQKQMDYYNKLPFYLKEADDSTRELDIKAEANALQRRALDDALTMKREELDNTWKIAQGNNNATRDAANIAANASQKVAEINGQSKINEQNNLNRLAQIQKANDKAEAAANKDQFKHLPTVNRITRQLNATGAAKEISDDLRLKIVKQLLGLKENDDINLDYLLGNFLPQEEFKDLYDNVYWYNKSRSPEQQLTLVELSPEFMTWLRTAINNQKNLTINKFNQGTIPATTTTTPVSNTIQLIKQ